MSKKSTLLSILGFAGACIAFYIGAGFATMQEVMQYVASYGSRFPIVILGCAVIYIYTNLSFAYNGNKLKLERGGDIYQAYCGKYIGIFYDYFSAVFCYACFIVMCGGANSTATQQWGLPNGVGAVILTVAVIATTMFGLNGILNALGKLGPIIIILLMIVAVVTAISGAGNYQANVAAIDAGVYELEQVGGGNPLSSAASYGGFVILWFASFLAEIGAKNRIKDVNKGMLLSAVCIFATTAVCSIALISHIDITAGADIPALKLAETISPAFAQALAVIVFCGIYTTAVPLLWTGVGKIATEGTKKYKLMTVAGGIAGCLVACFLPYKGLVNVLYGLNGYLGFILVAFMVIHDIRNAFKNKNENNK